MSWTELEEIRARLNKAWAKGKLLRSPLDNDDGWPLRYPLRHPAAGELGSRFAEAQKWVQRWCAHEEKHDFQLDWRDINSRDIGRNELPVAIQFDYPEDAQALIGKRRAGRHYTQLCEQITTSCPDLLDWCARKPLAVLELQPAWSRLLNVVHWLRQHPRPNVYIRQLELPCVDTKFIESHKKVLGELLDEVLPAGQIDSGARGVSGFEQRYGFLNKPAQIRFRLLDTALYIQGMNDLQIPVTDFARLTLPVQRIVITENEINGLALPNMPGAMVIFGLGYGLDSLKQVEWLADKAIYYWGDLDTHGFAMLDQLRSYFPQTQSLLMDRATLLVHEPLWGEEPKPTRKRLSRLTDHEQALYEDLCLDRLAPALRLEQERIGFEHVKAALAGLGGGT
ncbi:hypothetical protein CFI10_16415 [Marinobacterium iners]|uniref:Wadjet anti-phage system protein JetD domain-containing protein n=1 Tax=Marinobacterium iners TaxID=48076 RepID=UPI001A8DA689|nr:Wadjet anti-phage system protein JetD domain-containing protein [Marinobacterium iners]QSR36540.1 hypothetical protein CFI10_16415 [Marinobacterium iners]